uniref:Cadmium-induced protein AS8 isoform X2 n=1 Tax=Elaeis guineensis var. tenera TaxID=51953 RepID=A0A6I9QBY9_ELAGV|nr:cadmium-induced protein AS8 isoform X2 [Elaeis guineensis]
MPQVQPRRRETDVNGKLLVMIIKGLLRRYERWNPVHPTVGAFWGMGIGLGCGVGWGPGFGPEVVGYVGAGCGVGFSVGVTLAGVGVGLPRNGLIRIPLNGSGSLESARSYALTTVKSVAEDGLNYVAPHISFWRKENSGRLSSCKTNIHFDHRVKLTELSKTLSMHIRSTLECFEAVKDQCWPPRKDT